ncbi:GtrA family protein [Pedobacter antarcticus]|uniref:GtrA family protein n=1 Tax=Pedobacter antarcticus TaxID=34086 RepID=UPI00292ECDF5|nr:GtrA family protein [Pedobacter antarcticus]
MSLEKFSLKSLFNLIPPRLMALIRFGITGVSGLFIDFALTWFFKDELGINKFAANGIGFSAAVISNFLINRNWTFKGTRAKAAPQFTAFLMVSVIGLLLNSGIIYLLDNILHVNFYLSKAIAIFLVFFWNFSANYFFVFKSVQNSKS